MEAAPLPERLIEQVNCWRARLLAVGLIGQEPDRYDGYGFGNLSQRLDAGGFVITGTQTGGIPVLGSQHYATVRAANPQENLVVAEGPVKPSSESMAHATLYALDSRIGSVMHVHSPEMWVNRDALGMPVTHRDVPNGTPAMSEEVARLCKHTTAGVFAMGGHLDGIIAYGKYPQDTGTRLLAWHARALALC